MKITKMISGILFIVLFSTSVYAQKRSSINHTLRLELNEESQSRDIIINVLDENCNINFDVKGSIRTGKLSFEIYDPEGKKQRSISLNSVDITNDFVESITKETKISLSNNESIQGQTRLKLKNPKTGEWIIKIIPENAIGQIDIRAFKTSISKITYKINL